MTRDYLEARISKTCREVGFTPNKGFRMYEKDTQIFHTLEEVQKYLEDTYGKCKRRKMYRDPDAQQTGYIYCFKSPGGQGAPAGYYEQHWIEVWKVHAEIVIPRRKAA